MPEMESDEIDIVCAACGQGFSAPAGLAGKAERCPYCEELNDVPIPGDVAEELRDFDPGQALANEAPEPRFSLVWTIICLLAAGGFAAVVWHVYRSTWEQRNVDRLVLLYKQAEDDYRSGEFHRAAEEYHRLLNIAGDRQMTSQVLRKVVGESRERLPLAETAATRP